MAISPLSEASAILCFVLILLVPLAGVGLVLVNSGLVRSRSAAHVVLGSLCVSAVAALVYVAIGSSWEGFPGGHAHAVIIAGKGWDWIAAEPFFLRGLHLDLSRAALVVLLQTFGVGLAAMIPFGSGAERWRLGAACLSTFVFAGWTYPLFAHWALSGWLGQLGLIHSLGQGFVDGGAGTIQVAGGLSALSVAWILGPRRGKYESTGPAAIPGHNIVQVLTGCLLSGLGWVALNSAYAMLFYGSGLLVAALIVMNTALSASASALSAVFVTRLRFGRPDASLVANGWMAGLVASSAGAAFLKPATAVLTGLVAGALVVVAIDLLEFRLTIDDPGGSISVHGVVGLWGLLAVGLFSDAGGPYRGQTLAQLIGIATLLGFIFPLIHGLNLLANHFYPYRVDSEGEDQGMDLHELGAGAYPEFVVHSDEFTLH